MKSVVTILVMSLVLAGSIQAQPPDPVGEQFQVNSYTTSRQWKPAVANDSDGGFVVVWSSNGSFGADPGYSVQAQRFDSIGNPLGGQFQVNSYTTDYQQKPKVAFDDEGNFVVVWESYGSGDTDTSSYSVQGRLFDATGTPLGGDFQINSYTTYAQYRPSVAVNGQGSFVVVWASAGSYGTDTSAFSIQARLFGENGLPIAGEFQVNPYTSNSQTAPSVALDSNGNFIVVWESAGSYGTDDFSFSIQGQRFDASGTPSGGQFQVNSYTTFHQYRAAVSAASDGSFVVVWSSYGSDAADTDDLSIQAQRFDSAGAPAGGQFEVNAYTTGWQDQPSIALDLQGNFVVAWQSEGSVGSDNSDYSVQAQRFDFGGTPFGGQFQVNSYVTGNQKEASVAMGTGGDFVVVWKSYGSVGSDTSGASIQGQRFAGTTIFLDGFESGDTSAWSNAVP